ncbi:MULTISPECIES: hypothetical protein [unclassified Streptomyces]|uniref:hypothetical protein n=1 Tax=unclassified Streptomyces TaxID=2593676 RepID=UPI0036E8C486
MSWAGARVGVGTRFRYDGETVEVVELAITVNGNEAVLKNGRGKLLRLAVKELLLIETGIPIASSPPVMSRVVV